MKMDEPRAVARSTDPETSWEAAFSVTGIRETQWLIWSVLMSCGAKTDQEIFPILLEQHIERFEKPISTSGARTRRSELVKKGLVEWTGKKRKTEGGRNTRVWRALNLDEYSDKLEQEVRQLKLID